MAAPERGLDCHPWAPPVSPIPSVPSPQSPVPSPQYPVPSPQVPAPQAVHWKRKPIGFIRPDWSPRAPEECPGKHFTGVPCRGSFAMVLGHKHLHLPPVHLHVSPLHGTSRRYIGLCSARGPSALRDPWTGHELPLESWREASLVMGGVPPGTKGEGGSSERRQG